MVKNITKRLSVDPFSEGSRVQLPMGFPAKHESRLLLLSFKLVKVSTILIILDGYEKTHSGDPAQGSECFGRIKEQKHIVMV